MSAFTQREREEECHGLRVFCVGYGCFLGRLTPRGFFARNDAGVFFATVRRMFLATVGGGSVDGKALLGVVCNGNGISRGGFLPQAQGPPSPPLPPLLFLFHPLPSSPPSSAVPRFVSSTPAPSLPAASPPPLPFPLRSLRPSPTFLLLLFYSSSSSSPSSSSSSTTLHYATLHYITLHSTT